MNPFWINDVTELLATILLVSIPIVCAILYFRHRTLETNRRAEIMLRAMEKNNEGVSNEMLQGLNAPQKSLKERLLNKLLWGILSLVSGAGITASALLIGDEMYYEVGPILLIGLALLGVGVAFMIYFFVGRRMMSKELEAEKQSQS